MDRAGKRARDIKFHSKKNGKLVLVHSEEARAYCGLPLSERERRRDLPGLHRRVGAEGAAHVCEAVRRV